MTRQQLEHVIRAAAATVDTRDIVVIGSQAILGQFPGAPAELCESIEADVFPRDDPSLSIVIDGAIGEQSLFHSTFGYFAHGVDDKTAICPDGWTDRLVKIDTPATMGAVGWSLEATDLAISKLAAGREKDFRFVQAMARFGMIEARLMTDRLSNTPRMADESKRHTSMKLKAWFSQLPK